MIKTLKREALIYGVGRILASSISFLLLPFYTHNLSSTGEYGVLQLIVAFIAFSNIIFLFGFDAALMRYYVSESDVKEKRGYLTNTYFYLIFFGGILTALLIFFKDPLSDYIIAGKNSALITKLSWILFFDALRSIHMLILRAENKALHFMLLQVFDIFILTALNIFFVGYKQMGVEGVVLSNLISSSCIFIITFPIIFHRFDFQLLSIKHWKKLSAFAIPIVPAGVFWMILEFADRKMLEFLVSENSLHVVGVYGAGYKLGALMLLVVYAFNYAWRPYFLKNKSLQGFQKISCYVLGGLVFFWILMVLFVDFFATTSIPFFNISLINENYWSGLSIVPIIALAYIFHASFVLQEAEPFLTKKVYKISICRGVGVILNIILNLILIPKFYGAPYLGAALATVISYFTMSLMLYGWNYSNAQFRYNGLAILIFAFYIALAWTVSYSNIGILKLLVPILYCLQFKYYIRWQYPIKI